MAVGRQKISRSVGQSVGQLVGLLFFQTDDVVPYHVTIIISDRHRFDHNR